MTTPTYLDDRCRSDNGRSRHPFQSQFRLAYPQRRPHRLCSPPLKQNGRPTGAPKINNFQLTINH